MDSKSGSSPGSSGVPGGVGVGEGGVGFEGGEPGGEFGGVGGLLFRFWGFFSVFVYELFIFSIGFISFYLA